MSWARALMALLLGGRGRAVTAGDWPARSPEEASGEPPTPPTLVIDPQTRTFWSHGAVAPTTLVEVGSAAEPVPVTSRRLADLMAGGAPNRGGRPRANPAFSEAVFVELMRARQYRRAFELLSPECRRSWGSAERFAGHQARGSMDRLERVEVKAVRYLDEWTDPERLTRHRQVAELDVEYTVSSGAGSAVLPRTVHLVPEAGRWRSLCYPSASS